MIRLTAIFLLALTAVAQPLPFPIVNVPEVVQYAQVAVKWDGSLDAAGYKVHFGDAPGHYTNTVDVGPLTLCSVDLPVGVTNYLAATSYNLTGVESDYSTEIAYVPHGPLPLTNVIVTIVLPMLMSSNLINWTETNTIIAVLTNPPGNLFFRPAVNLRITLTNF